MSNAADPNRWLVLYNAEQADSIAWVEDYRSSRRVPYANLLGLSLGTAGNAESIDEATFETLRDTIIAYLALNGLSQVRGILIGYLLPGVVTIDGTDYSLASLLADLSDATPEAENPYYLAGLVEPADLPARSTFIDGTRYLTAEINAPSLALATGLLTGAEALTSRAALDELVSALDPDTDRLAAGVAGTWAALTDWLDTANQQRLALPRQSGGWSGADHGYAVDFSDATSGAFSVTGQTEALLVTVGAETAATVRSGSTLAKLALDRGYPFVIGQTDTAGGLLNPSALLAVLNAGGCWAEALAAATPTINTTWRPIGDPLWGFRGPRQSFALYRQPGDALVAIVPAAEPYQLDLENKLPDGTWDLELVRVDKFGSVSEAATTTITVSGGVGASELIEATVITANAIEGGEVALTWHGVDSTESLAVPAEWEIAEGSDLGTVLATVEGGRRGFFSAEVGPFDHGSTVRLFIRPSDGVSVVGAWVPAPVVIADSVGPPAPQIIGV